jgi:hypothetical protein
MSSYQTERHYSASHARWASSMLYPAEEARLDRIHIDIDGGGATLPPAIAQAIDDSEFDYKDASQPSVRDARYFILITDDYSRYR